MTQTETPRVSYSPTLIDRIDNALLNHGFRLFGRFVALYPIRCAMHGAVNVESRRWGWICFRPLPVRSDGHWFWPYLYTSPDATPNRATHMWGYRAR